MKSKKWGTSLLCLASIPAILLLASSLVFTGGSAIGYEAVADDLGSGGMCADCHDFTAKGSALHTLHTGNPDPITANCDLCHGPDKVKLTMWSSGDSGNDGLGCMGCHGRDYGETIQANHNGYQIAGKPKNSGYGLRQHHRTAEADTCYTSTCHVNDNPQSANHVTPYPENVINPGLGNTTHYYFRSDVNLGGNAVDPGSNEDSGNDTNGYGLDNDGDGLYDMNDPDCVATPERLLMSQINPVTGTFTLSWPTPSSAWRLQQNPLLNAAGWVDATPPARSQRVNGYWTLEFTPQQAKEFFRLTN